MKRGLGFLWIISSVVRIEHDNATKRNESTFKWILLYLVRRVQALHEMPRGHHRGTRKKNSPQMKSQRKKLCFKAFDNWKTRVGGGKGNEMMQYSFPMGVCCCRRSIERGEWNLKATTSSDGIRSNIERQ